MFIKKTKNEKILDKNIVIKNKQLEEIIPYRLFLKDIHIADFQSLYQLKKHVTFQVSSITNKYQLKDYIVKERKLKHKGLLKQTELITEEIISWDKINDLLKNNKLL